MTPMPSFEEFFKALWDHEPFPWQNMLAQRIANKGWPQALNLPTASGKTACMDVAIWSLAHQADRAVSQRSAPRRTWFVVDRRIVVDEAYDRATRIAAMLEDAGNGPLEAVANRLGEVGGTKRSLAVARLRGGILHDDGWARLPSQPAVITATVDQLGSRLLFRGYGRSHRTAPIFAGLAAHDSLILLDEAHCAVPFLQTLRAVERYRGKDWAETPIKTPFAFAFLSATPPQDIPANAGFPGSQRERALDHPILLQRTEASKAAELVSLQARRSSREDPLVVEASKRARGLVDDQGRLRVAVIVNRVRTAIEISEQLRHELAGRAEIVLLTGRLRPYERDHLVESWKPFLRARDPQRPERPVVLVSTQCIEVGADFSFDALVTEAASLDALRQRFGRLNRLGELDSSPAVVVIREDDWRATTSDPIYGTAIGETWRLLEENATEKAGSDGKARKFVDFGITAIDRVLADVENLSPCLAPTPDAPALLPAHIDLLCQTAPVPRPDPDIELFLHGVGRGVPEARVAWRADLDRDLSETWKEVIALCPPISGETLSVPLFHLRQWLAEDADQADIGDVEGSVTSEKGEGKKDSRIRPAVVWAGRDRSRVARWASELSPNDVVIVPAEYGMVQMGQSEPHKALGRQQLDLWEVARLDSGRPSALRLHHAVLEPWLDCPPVRDLVRIACDPAWERDDLQDAIDAVLAHQAAMDEETPTPPDWLRALLKDVRRGRMEAHPCGGLVLFTRVSSSQAEAEPDLFADDDDLLSASGSEVSLAIHSELVERAVRKIASRCLGSELLETLSTAAYWHDVGKLDERFQVLLREGDELAAVAGEPLAKSREIPASPARRQAIREASGLPENFRHELLSAQVAEQCARLPEQGDMAELALHLIGSHHGHLRPFAPICRDPSPPDIAGVLDGHRIDVSAGERRAICPPHEAASATAERFWRLNRRYGWWGLAYLEAILRLGDWYGSQHVVDDPGGERPPRSSGVRRFAPAATPPQAIVLSGIDGANPLGFLTAVGTLAVLHGSGEAGARLRWKRSATWQPVLSGIAPDGPVFDSRREHSSVDLEDAVARVVAEALRGNEVQNDAERKRKDAQDQYDAARKAHKDKLKEIKDRRLPRRDREAAIEVEVKSLSKHEERCRQAWQSALRNAVPRTELAIGKHIDCSRGEFREHVDRFSQGTGIQDREALDFLAAFASDANLHESPTKRAQGVLAATPFCFISGSGHQYFLETVRQLMNKVAPDRVRATLFEIWQYQDEKLSMRWDPFEDRRYALMDRDPTDSGNEPRTVWMANLLAYRGLLLFPSVPRRGGLATTAWSLRDGEPVFTWPIWRAPLGLNTIRSLLLLPELAEEEPEHVVLRARGVVAVFRARRIKVGSGTNYKVNFSVARNV